MVKLINLQLSMLDKTTTRSSSVYRDAESEYLLFSSLPDNIEYRGPYRIFRTMQTPNISRAGHWRDVPISG